VSDTGSPPSTSPGRGRCCAKVLLACGLACGLAVFHVVRVVRATEPQPLPFEPFRYRPLERSLLAGKFDILEGAGRFLGNSAEVDLDERELNAMLFGDKPQAEGGKARVLIQGDHLVIESSQRQAEADGAAPGEARYHNVRAEVDLALGPGGLLKLDLVDGQIADHHLDPVLRALTQWALRKAVGDAVAQDPRLSRVKSAMIRGGRVNIVYDPPK
jgi:hypothetical protein